MSRNKDIAVMLGKTEANNTANVRLFQSNEEVGLDSAQVSAVGLQKFTTLDSLPSSNLTSGQQAWVESSGRLYISNGSGWYNVALVNASPTLTLDQSGTIQLNADTLSVTVTASATDPDDPSAIITFSVESDGNMVGTGTSLSQDSSVFTITAQSEDSGGTSGNFTLTFKATDQIAVDNESLSFSLTFANIIDSSASTMFLLKAVDSGDDNTVVTYLDSNQATQTFSTQNQPATASFSPYRDAGYSAFFDNTTYSTDFLGVAHDTSLSVEGEDFTIEGWFNMKSWVSNASVFGKWHQGSIANRNEWLIYYSGSLKFIYSTDGQNTANTLSFGTPSLNEWHHFAVCRTNDEIKIYLDGVLKATQAETSNIYSASATHLRVGRFNSGGGLNGYAFDYRIVKGSCIYTAAFTPPTEKLTAVTNTSVLFLRKGHYGYQDESGNNHKVVKNGLVETQPQTPHDYQPWVADDYGGSLYSSSNDYVKTGQGTGIANFGTGDFTIDCWWYPISSVSATNNPFISTTDGGSSATTMQFIYASDTFNYAKGTTNVQSATNLAEPRSWYHVVLQRSSASTNMWVNGERVVSGHSDTQNYSVDEEFQIGRNRSNNQDINGYLADVRVVKGSAVYTVGDTITVPTSPLSHVSGTTMLMQNKNTKIYDAAAANAFWLDGGAQGDWETSGSNGIRKFTTSSSVWSKGSSNHYGATIAEGVHAQERFMFASDEKYTIEGWVYPNDEGTDMFYGSGGGTGSWSTASGHYQLFFSQSNTLYYQYQKGSNGVQSINIGAVGTHMPKNNWYHIALTHDGTTHRVFINGVVKGSSTTDIVPLTGDAFKVRLGGSPSNTGFQAKAYFQSWRVKKGVCLYDAAFTPPTAEFEL